MLEQLTIKCACSERIAPDEYDSHQERCSNVTFPCPHEICRVKVRGDFFLRGIKLNIYFLNRMIQQNIILNN
jgi:hypothetical protein